MARAQRRASSPAKKNGHGGKRDGAGRKQERLPKDLIEEIGPPPTNPLDKNEWYERVQAVLLWGFLRGKPWVTMLREARASSLVAAKLMQDLIESRVAKIQEREDREAQADASPRVTKVKEDRIAAVQARAFRRDPS